MGVVARSALSGVQKISCGLARGMTSGLGLVSGCVTLNEKCTSSSSTEHFYTS